MKRSISMILFALALAMAGGALLFAGFFERRMGVAQEDMAVLDFEDPQSDYQALQQEAEKFPTLSRATLKEIRARRASLQYWQGRYTDLMEMTRNAPPEGEAPDPELLLMAANAAYRTTQHGPQDKVTLLKNLDGVIRAYAEALHAGTERTDAAFNYELAVRIRDEITAGKRKSMPAVSMVEDKSDANMHGDPGEPPKDMKTEQFQIRIPMDPKDFKSSQQETAGTGQVRKRKG